MQGLVEQKITKQVTINNGNVGEVSISIPKYRKVFLKGYGYSWYASNIYRLDTGNRQFPNRSDQEGSISQPMQWAEPFPCRSGGQLKLHITNNDSSNHTYTIVFYILTDDYLEETSEGGEIVLNTVTASGGSSVFITDSTGSNNVAVTSNSLNVIEKSPSTLVTGQTSTAGATAIELASSTSISRVTIQNDVLLSGGPVYVGNSTAQYVYLERGQSIDLQIDNLNKVYIKRATSNNATVNYIAS